MTAPPASPTSLLRAFGLGLWRFLTRFLLPLLGFGLGLYGLQLVLRRLGFSGIHAQTLRYVLFGFYGLLALRMFRGGGGAATPESAAGEGGGEEAVGSVGGGGEGEPL